MKYIQPREGPPSELSCAFRPVSVDDGPRVEALASNPMQSRKLLGLDKIEALLSKKVVVVSRPAPLLPMSFHNLPKSFHYLCH